MIDRAVDDLNSFLINQYEEVNKVIIQIEEENGKTLAGEEKIKNEEQIIMNESRASSDPLVQEYVDLFDATIEENQMKHFSPILQDLVNAFKGLPGIGVKSAQRIVFNLIQQNQEKALFLSDAIKNALDNINECSNCRMYTDSEVCEICSDQKRDSALLCVIESPADMIAIENSMSFNGRYFVLMGKLSPLDGIGPDQLKLDKLESIIKMAP